MNTKKPKQINKSLLMLTIVSIFAPLVCVLAFGSIVAARYWKEFFAPPGARIINAYFRAQGIITIPGSNEYSSRMKGILMGSYPGLTSENSTFAPTTEDRDAVEDYASGTSPKAAGKSF